jgi:hypothetical protein
MTLVILLFVLGAVLVGTLLHFLRVKDRPAMAQRVEAPSLTGQAANAARDGDLQFLGDAIFSEGDWDFIRGEDSPLLTELFRKERRALAARWLNHSAERIRTIREEHVRNSRFSQDLNVLAEVKLLVLFVYLITLCRGMSLVVRVAQPTAPRTLALHFEKMAGRLAPQQGAVISHAPAEELRRSPS